MLVTISGVDMEIRNSPHSSISKATIKKGMVLPFQPLSLAFDHVNYYVDMPTVSFNTLSSYLKTFSSGTIL